MRIDWLLAKDTAPARALAALLDGGESALCPIATSKCSRKSSGGSIWRRPELPVRARAQRRRTRTSNSTESPTAKSSTVASSNVR
jgi:hypothetical protein